MWGNLPNPRKESSERIKQNSAYTHTGLGTMPALSGKLEKSVIHGKYTQESFPSAVGNDWL